MPSAASYRIDWRRKSQPCISRSPKQPDGQTQHMGVMVAIVANVMRFLDSRIDRHPAPAFGESYQRP